MRRVTTLDRGEPLGDSGLRKEGKLSFGLVEKLSDFE